VRRRAGRDYFGPDEDRESPGRVEDTGAGVTEELMAKGRDRGRDQKGGKKKKKTKKKVKEHKVEPGHVGYGKNR
jgi:hypothetical protein